ncbi:MAG TPA: hypothetical protein VD884_01230 [Ohtaekwangia sp.]|nr:hypothetical protein [Ohtaekwangia sp.]
MLKSISWQEFLTVLSVLSLIYYSILGLVYYRVEIKNLISGKGKSDASPRPSTRSSNSLIGQIREEEGIDEDEDQSTISSDQINPAQNHPQDALLGTVADLLKDLKEIIDSIATSKTEKGESLVLIKAVFSRYEQLRDTNYQQPVELFLYENAIDQFPFELSLEEIKKLWTR